MNGVNSVFSSLQGWLQQPFNPQMSAKDWFLFGGLILVIVGVWIMIFRDLTHDIKIT